MDTNKHESAENIEEYGLAIIDKLTDFLHHTAQSEALKVVSSILEHTTQNRLHMLMRILKNALSCFLCLSWLKNILSVSSACLFGRQVYSVVKNGGAK